MKFSKSGHALLAAVASVGIGLGIISCGESNTIDYLYVTNSKNNPGQVSVYRVDLQSGALTQIQDSPYSTIGRNPVAEVASPNGQNLYVVNHDTSDVVEYAIGTDGKLYSQHQYSVTASGSSPQAIAINAAGTFLYVVNTFQPSTQTGQTLTSGPGALVVYPVNPDGSLGTALTDTVNGQALSYWPIGTTPLAVNVTANGNFVYVVNQVGTSANGASVSEFSVGSGGTLTELPGSPLAVGVSPNAIATDPTNRFAFVTDGATNQVISFTISSSGALTPQNQSGGLTATGTFPDAITVDPSGQFVYVANYTSNTISAYAIVGPNGSAGGQGQLTGLAGAATYSTKTGPTCVFVEPAFGRFVYTSNFLDSSVTGYQLNPNTGALTGTVNSPYPVSPAGQPTCVAAVTHGNHPGEHVQATAGTGAQ
jgi:6-phosphogluconolactonase